MKFLVEGRPTLTAMVQAKTLERTLELIKKGIAGGADAFGVQLETLKCEYHSRECIEKIFAAAEGRPIYITNYRSGENEGKSDEELTDKLLSLADLPEILIDIMGDSFDPTPTQITYDSSAAARQTELISRLHEKGAEVLISSHTGRFLPKAEIIKAAEAQMHRGADISKIVNFPSDASQLLENFEISAALAQKIKIPTLFLGAGEGVERHRRIAPFIGNDCMYLCVVEHDELATSFQPLLSMAKLLVDTVNS